MKPSKNVLLTLKNLLTPYVLRPKCYLARCCCTVRSVPVIMCNCNQGTDRGRGDQGPTHNCGINEHKWVGNIHTIKDSVLARPLHLACLTLWCCPPISVDPGTTCRARLRGCINSKSPFKSRRETMELLEGTDENSVSQMKGQRLPSYPRNI